MDAIRAAFLQVSSDGHSLGREEWPQFFEALRADGILPPLEAQQQQHLFWDAGEEGGPPASVSYAELRRHLAKGFLTTHAPGTAYQALQTTRAATAQLQTMTALVGEPEPRLLARLLERCATMDRALAACEANLLETCRRAELSLEGDRLRALVGDSPLEDPLEWQIEHVIDVERHASSRRVISLSHIRYLRTDDDNDDPCVASFFRHHLAVRRWLVAQGWARSEGVAVREAQVVCADGKERGAYVVELTRCASRARMALWHGYGACRNLAAAPRSAPHALGWFDDHPGDEVRRQTTKTAVTRFVYERVRAQPLRAELERVARRGEKTKTLVASASPLVRHWLREALTRAVEIESMVTYELNGGDRPFGTANLWIAEHGAALRVGGLRWGDEITRINASRALRNRTRQLLAGFADVAEDIICALCPRGPKATSNKRYTEADVSAGILVVPGEHFDVILNVPLDPRLCWRYPRLTPCQRQVVRLVDPPPEPGAPVKLCDDVGARLARLRFVAVHPGATQLTLRCSTATAGPLSSRTAASSALLTLSICVAASGVDGPLRAILRSCRLLATNSIAPAQSPPPPGSTTSPWAPRSDDARSLSDVDAVALTPSSLLRHDYFKPLSKDELVQAMATYERLFLAGEEENQQQRGRTAAPIRTTSNKGTLARGEPRIR